MGILQKYLDSIKTKREKIADVKDSIDIPAKIMEKKKSANEREYERYLEEERQEHIKRELKRFREKRQNELWHKNVISGDKNMFNGDSVFKENGRCMLKWR